MYENSFTLKKMLAAYPKLLRFSGRSTRTELLGYLLTSWLFSVVLGYAAMIAAIARSVDVGIASFDFVRFLLWLPFPALAVRRFHDQSKSGLWAAPLVVPTVLFWMGGESLLPDQPLRLMLGALYVAALVLLFWKPTDGHNRYGPDPRLTTDDWEAVASDT